MPRQPQPWFREGRGWYVQLNGQQVHLGEHPPPLPKPQRNANGEWKPPQLILDAFYGRMATKPVPPSPIPLGRTFVAQVLDDYLDWLENRVQEGSKAQRTYAWYQSYLQDFLSFQGSFSKTLTNWRS